MFIELNDITPIERRILGYRFGFINGKINTRKDAAKRFRVTEERIRRLEKFALEKLTANLLLILGRGDSNGN